MHLLKNEAYLIKLTTKFNSPKEGEFSEICS